MLRRGESIDYADLPPTRVGGMSEPVWKWRADMEEPDRVDTHSFGREWNPALTSKDA